MENALYDELNLTPISSDEIYYIMWYINYIIVYAVPYTWTCHYIQSPNSQIDLANR